MSDSTRSPASVKQTGERLPELCSELFAFALSLRSAKDPGDAGQLTATVARLLETLSRQARDANVDSAHLEAARYALCASIDETVLGSRWEIKTTWMSSPLQMTYFGDFTAGEQFYRRLDELRTDASHNIDAIEVYAMCLAAGFRGKHVDLAGMQKVDDLLAELGTEIRQHRGINGRALARPFERNEVLPQAVRRIPVWIIAAACAGVVLIVLFLLDGLLASQAADFLATGEVAR